MDEVAERRCCAHVALVIAVELHSPVRGMNPAEVKRADPFETFRIARIEPESDVLRCAENVKLVAHVAAGAASGHRIDN